MYLLLCCFKATVKAEGQSPNYSGGYIMKKLLALLIAGVMVFSLFTVIPAAAEYTDDSFVFLASGPVTLNPLQSQSSNDTDVFYLIYTSLVRMYQDEVEMDGAYDVIANDTATEFTFKIRDNIYYTNGDQVTANDYAFYFEATLDPAYGSPNAGDWGMIENAEAFSNGECAWEDVGIKVVDDYTLTFNLSRSFSDFVTYVAADFVVPLQKDFVDATGDAMGSSIDTIMSCGPYILTDWVLETSLTFEKNPQYWNAENSFFVQHVEALEVSNANTKVSMYEDGTADAMMVVPVEYLPIMMDPVITQPTGGINMLWLNGNNASSALSADEQAAHSAIMDNANFGLALSYALNREAIVDAVYTGAIPAVRLVSDMFAVDGVAFSEANPVDYVGITGDTAKAQEYLAAALAELGYGDVSELPVLSYVTYENPSQKGLAEAIIDTWKKVLGINVQLEQYNIGTAIGMFYTGAFDMFNIGIDCGIYSYALMEAFIPGGDYANGCWNNDEFNELIVKAQYAATPEEALEYAAQAEVIMLSDAGVLPIFYQGSAHTSHEWVENYAVSTIGAGWQINYVHVTK